MDNDKNLNIPDSDENNNDKSNNDLNNENSYQQSNEKQNSKLNQFAKAFSFLNNAANGEDLFNEVKKEIAGRDPRETGYFDEQEFKPKHKIPPRSRGPIPEVSIGAIPINQEIIDELFPGLNVNDLLSGKVQLTKEQMQKLSKKAASILPEIMQKFQDPDEFEKLSNALLKELPPDMVDQVHDILLNGVQIPFDPKNLDKSFHNLQDTLGNLFNNMNSNQNDDENDNEENDAESEDDIEDVDDLIDTNLELNLDSNNEMSEEEVLDASNKIDKMVQHVSKKSISFIKKDSTPLTPNLTKRLTTLDFLEDNLYNVFDGALEYYKRKYKVSTDGLKYTIQVEIANNLSEEEYNAKYLFSDKNKEYDKEKIFEDSKTSEFYGRINQTGLKSLGKEIDQETMDENFNINTDLIGRIPCLDHADVIFKERYSYNMSVFPASILNNMTGYKVINSGNDNNLIKYDIEDQTKEILEEVFKKEYSQLILMKNTRKMLIFVLQKHNHFLSPKDLSTNVLDYIIVYLNTNNRFSFLYLAQQNLISALKYHLLFKPERKDMPSFNIASIGSFKTTIDTSDSILANRAGFMRIGYVMLDSFAPRYSEFKQLTNDDIVYIYAKTTKINIKKYTKFLFDKNLIYKIRDKIDDIIIYYDSSRKMFRVELDLDFDALDI